MPFDLEMFGSKVKRYMEQFQVSEAELGDKTGIPAKRVSGLIKGTEHPSGDEVLILADFFKCDYRFFVSNEKLAPFEQTEQLFRRHGDVLSREDRWNIQEFLYLCECQQFLLELLPGSSAFKSFTFKKSGTYYKSHGHEAARSLRSVLGYVPHSVPLNIYRDFRNLGIHIFRRKLGQGSISGIYVRHPLAGHCILVNYSEDSFRQRFTAAHEVGHALLDDGEDISISFSKWDKTNLSEVRANAFASHFLLPPEFLTRIPDASNWSPEKFLDYAKKLKVNADPLAFALREANLISRNELDKLRQLKVAQEDKTDPELHSDLGENAKLRKMSLLERGLSEDYVRLCLQAYEQNLITRGRLAEMLLVDEYQVGELCRLYGRTLDYAF